MHLMIIGIAAGAAMYHILLCLAVQTYAFTFCDVCRWRAIKNDAAISGVKNTNIFCSLVGGAHCFKYSFRCFVHTVSPNM